MFSTSHSVDGMVQLSGVPAEHEVGKQLPTDPQQVGLAIQVGDRGAQRGVGDHQPPPRLSVRPVGRLQADAQALADFPQVDRDVEVERLARRWGGGEQVVDVNH